jgi:hypothetical protein
MTLYVQILRPPLSNVRPQSVLHARTKHANKQGYQVQQNPSNKIHHAGDWLLRLDDISNCNQYIYIYNQSPQICFEENKNSIHIEMETNTQYETQSMDGNCSAATMHHNRSDTTPTETAPTNLERLPMDIFLNVVLPYVGSSRYRFHESCSPNFPKQYRTLFPSSDVMEQSTSQLLPDNLNFLRYLDTLNCPWNTRICEKAAKHGFLEMLQWARANGCSWDKRTCAGAAQNGNLELLQWARANGCPWDECTCFYAAVYGHLEILRWARANGCPWHKDTCAIAAQNGHLKILQWARANGCPWDKRTCTCAAYHGQLEILQWARANGCPQ